MTITLATWPTARNDATEDRWSSMMGRLFSDGVHANTSDTNEFRPYGDSTGMHAKIDTGAVNISGFYAESLVFQTLSVAAAHSTLNRLDLLVLRLDRTSPCTIYLDVLTGSPASSPAVPALTANSTITEIPVGVVTVGHGVSTVRDQDVTDARVYCLPKTSLPAGSVMDFLGTVAPPGWLFLQGQTGLSVVTYPALAKACPELVISGSISLPDMQSKFTVGANGNLGQSGGASSVTLTTAHVPPLPVTDPGHAHPVDGDTGERIAISKSGAQSNNLTGPANPGITFSHVGAAATGISVNAGGGGTPVPTVPPYVAMNKIIKAH